MALATEGVEVEESVGTMLGDLLVGDDGAEVDGVLTNTMPS